MAIRKGISASLRWTVFARDGFMCRYCGAQAGQENVELVIDHILSVADGGDNRIDNLATACRGCNSGKSARSLSSAPTSQEVIERINQSASNLQAQADALRLSSAVRGAMDQEIINLKCTAYGVENVKMASGELAIISRLCKEFGADVVTEWYSSAAQNNVYPHRAIKYVCGCARNAREKAMGANG